MIQSDIPTQFNFNVQEILLEEVQAPKPTVVTTTTVRQETVLEPISSTKPKVETIVTNKTIVSPVKVTETGSDTITTSSQVTTTTTTTRQLVSSTASTVGETVRMVSE